MTRREGGINWERSGDKYALPCIKHTASETLQCSSGSSAQWSVMTQGGGIRGKRWETQQGADICVYTADSLCCTAEANMTS